MKYVIKETEPTVQIVLKQNSPLYDGDSAIEIIGKPGIGADWLIATITHDGKFQPNKAGCAKVGLKIDNTFNQ